MKSVNLLLNFMLLTTTVLTGILYGVNRFHTVLVISNEKTFSCHNTLNNPIVRSLVI